MVYLSVELESVIDTGADIINTSHPLSACFSHPVAH